MEVRSRMASYTTLRSLDCPLWPWMTWEWCGQKCAVGHLATVWWVKETGIQENRNEADMVVKAGGDEGLTRTGQWEWRGRGIRETAKRHLSEIAVMSPCREITCYLPKTFLRSQDLRRLPSMWDALVKRYSEFQKWMDPHVHIGVYVYKALSWALSFFVIIGVSRSTDY